MSLRSRVVSAACIAALRVLTGVRAQWLGCGPAPQPRIYFANHSSHLDGVVIWSALPRTLRAHTRPVAARDYWDASPLRRFLASEVFGAVLIERKAAGHARGQVLEPLFDALDRGDSLILFPEGTRGDGEAIAPFKSGLYHLARQRPAVELVPVYLDKLHRVLPKGAALPVPLLCGLRFGAPLALADGECREPFLARARAAVEALRG